MYRVLMVCLLMTLPFSSLAEVIHKERSLYRNILVEKTGDLLCLKFRKVVCIRVSLKSWCLITPK